MIGTDPGQANLVKLLGNMMSATTLEMLGEAVALVLKLKLDPKPFIDILTGTMFGGRVHRIYGDKIVTQSYAPGLVMPLALKDARLALAEAENAGVPMPSISVVRDRLITGFAPATRVSTGLRSAWSPWRKRDSTSSPRLPSIEDWPLAPILRPTPAQLKTT